MLELVSGFARSPEGRQVLRGVFVTIASEVVKAVVVPKPEKTALDIQKQHLAELRALRESMAGQAPSQSVAPAAPAPEPPAAAAPTPPAPAARPKPGKPYSKYAPWMKPDTNCVACSMAHLGAVEADLRRAAQEWDERPLVQAEPGSAYASVRDGLTEVAAVLKEATRFANEDGTDHPEAQRRILDAQAQLAAIERDELANENLRDLPEDQRAALEALQPKLRRLRQAVYTATTTPEGLREASGDAGAVAAELWGNPRLRTVDEELSALYRYDWSEENIAQSPEGEQAIVRPLVEPLRELHKAVRSNPDREDLIKLADVTAAIRRRIALGAAQLAKGGEAKAS